jgi:hypothetical protein
LTEFRLGPEILTNKEESKTKTRTFFAALFLLAFAFVPSPLWALPPPPPLYTPTLISPVAGQVLYSGQIVRVEWKPTIQYTWPSWCELELWLSLDGGRTYTLPITPSLDPNTRFFYWTVPNTPTNAAVLQIRFGCEPVRPEGFYPQTTSAFVIASVSGQ